MHEVHSRVDWFIAPDAGYSEQELTKSKRNISGSAAFLELQPILLGQG